MPTVVLIGTGNVAHHLFRALKENIIQVFGRNEQALREFSESTSTTSSIDELVAADLYLLAVSDDAIKEVSRQFSHVKGLLAHTSGSVPISQLSSERKAVFYPLQTFTFGRDLNFSTIPICLEATNKEDYGILEELANSISKSVYRINTEQRKKLHLAAVFANNFSNHIFQIAMEICEQENVDFDLLKPLIIETINKIEHLNPIDAQTGPAKRNDIQTMQAHLEGLQDPMHKKIYQMLSKSIRKSHEEKL
ncbi:Rossmann-like and DUF2520 domain-containing protein [Croceivirga thetidis]|uniref:DUF2520 domain-containing protein n=1 Tax=Croceivirga thetidis TaxID=2721623 RepID=A0ABX1GTN2_9FLAO|nr:DUF2520 domain-containing protein [Croceivirga thetidis]NKI32082.1 DUF2520 domain-containing protein [Croceivirga thetidis]